MKNTEEELVILDIGTWSSKCLSCGGGASMSEKTHKSLPGYNVGDREGCGKTFTHVTTMYSHIQGHIREMRPDLKWINPELAIKERNKNEKNRRR